MMQLISIHFTMSTWSSPVLSQSSFFQKEPGHVSQSYTIAQPLVTFLGERRILVQQTAVDHPGPVQWTSLFPMALEPVSEVHRPFLLRCPSSFPKMQSVIGTNSQLQDKFAR